MTKIHRFNNKDKNKYKKTITKHRRCMLPTRIIEKCAIKIGYRLDLLRALNSMRRMHSSYNQVFVLVCSEQQRYNKIKHLNCVVCCCFCVCVCECLLFIGWLFAKLSLPLSQCFTPINSLFCVSSFDVTSTSHYTINCVRMQLRLSAFFFKRIAFKHSVYFSSLQCNLPSNEMVVYFRFVLFETMPYFCWYGNENFGIIYFGRDHLSIQKMCANWLY